MSKYPDHLSPGSPRHRNTRRQVSGVLSLFQAQQVQQFKEAFQLIDHDKDGWVTESDLKDIFGNLGISPTKKMLDDLLTARPGGTGPRPFAVQEDSEKGINFTMFLTMMSERLFEFDTETELRQVFECFDEGDTGSVKVDEMHKWMSEVGERMDQHEIDKFLKSSFSDRQGNFNYREWIKVLSVNDESEAPHS